MAGKKNVKSAIADMAAAVRKKFAGNKDANVGIGLTSLPRVTRWVPTGCPPLDIILGGGIPCGRITELYGDESHGKSAVGESILASAQKEGIVPILIDTEYSLEEQKAQRWGLNLPELLPLYPETMEQCFDIIHTTIEAQKKLEMPVVIVWDTMAATPTQKELDARYGDETPARQARVMSNALKKIYQEIAKTETSLVVLNQTREKIGVQFGSKKTTPGGKALRFYASIRAEIRIIKRLKKDETVIGIETEIRTVKNKLTHPLKTCLAHIYFASGVHPGESILATLKKLGLLKASGVSLKVAGQSFKKEELLAGLKQDKDVEKELKRLIHDAIFI